MEATLFWMPRFFPGRARLAAAYLAQKLTRLFAAAGEPQADAARDDVNARAAEILDRYGNMLLRYAYSYLHNMDDAEEVLQDALVQFLKTAPRFASSEHEKAWLLRVAGNLSKNRLNYNKLRQTDELRRGGRTWPLSGRPSGSCRKNTARPSTFFITRAARQSRSRKSSNAARRPSGPICTGAGPCCARF